MVLYISKTTIDIDIDIILCRAGFSYLKALIRYLKEFKNSERSFNNPILAISHDADQRSFGRFS